MVYELGKVINGIRLDLSSKDLKYAWNRVRDTLLEIKRHSYAMHTFLLCYNKDNVNEFLIGRSRDPYNSLEEMIQRIDFFIKNEGRLPGSLKDIEEDLRNLKSKFEGESSSIYNLLANNSSDVKEVWTKQLKESGLENKIEVIETNNNFSDYRYPIHDIVINDCFSELLKNIHNHAVIDTVKVNINNYDDKIEIELKSQKNKKEKEAEDNKNSGLKKIKNLLKCYNGDLLEIKNDNISLDFEIKMRILKHYR